MFSTSALTQPLLAAAFFKVAALNDRILMEKLRLHIILRQLLDEHGFTMRELSRQTGIPEATLSGYANGAEPSKMQHLRVLAKFFNISLEELMYGDSEPSKIKSQPIFTGWLCVKVEGFLSDKTK